MPGFLLLTTLGSAVWNTVLVCIGSVLGSAWEQAMPYFEQYTHIAAVVIVLAAVRLCRGLSASPAQKSAGPEAETAKRGGKPVDSLPLA